MATAYSVRRLILLLLLTGLLASCEILTGSGSSSGGDDDADGIDGGEVTQSDLSGDVSIDTADASEPDGGDVDDGPVLPPQGADTAPTLDTLLSEDTPTTTTTLTMDGTGAGEITLGNGTRVTVPAGAMPASSSLTIYRYAPDTAPEDYWHDVYRFEATQQPTGIVTIQFVVPGFSEGAVPSESQVIWFHGDESPVFLDNTADGTLGTITVEVDSFSSAVVQSRKSDPIPAMIGDNILRTPYYPQGTTQNCWSASMTAFLGAYGAENEPWNNGAFFKISSEHGLPFWQFVHSQALVTHIQIYLPDAQVQQRSWWTSGGADHLRRYLERNMRTGRPTLMHYFSNEAGVESAHMVLFVGIEGDEFVIHDPQNQNSFVAYSRKSWEQILPRFQTAGFDGAGTVALATPATDTTWGASIIVPNAERLNQGFSAIRRENNQFDRESTRLFTWYAEAVQHATIVDTTGTPSTLKLDHRISFEVDVTNLDPEADCSATATATDFQVGFEIVDVDGLVKYTHPEVTESLCPSETTTVQLLSATVADATDFEALIGERPGQWVVRGYVAENGVRYDSFEIPVLVVGSIESDPGDGLPCPLSDDPLFTGDLIGSAAGVPFAFGIAQAGISAALIEGPDGEAWLSMTCESDEHGCPEIMVPMREPPQDRGRHVVSYTDFLSAPDGAVWRVQCGGTDWGPRNFEGPEEYETATVIIHQHAECQWLDLTIEQRAIVWDDSVEDWRVCNYFATFEGRHWEFDD